MWETVREKTGKRAPEKRWAEETKCQSHPERADDMSEMYKEGKDERKRRLSV